MAQELTLLSQLPWGPVPTLLCPRGHPGIPVVITMWPEKGRVCGGGYAPVCRLGVRGHFNSSLSQDLSE